jgi:formamidopyrimidine-DNA glycosylase
MPELPEVEVVRQGLSRNLEHQPRIVKIELLRKNLREDFPVAEIQSFVGLRITHIERRAKYLLLWSSQGALLSHLGMTGTWRLAPPGDERLHDHVYIHFEKNLRLAYRDPRRFGILDVVREVKTHPKLKDLGPEPLLESFTGEIFWQSLRNKNTAVKVALMDQKIVVGVGNIYANEALFRAKIKPHLIAKKLSLGAANRLVAEIKKVLTEAIAQGGSSINDFAQTSGDSGYFQMHFKIYGQEGKPCVQCDRKIKNSVLGGRATFWCSQCQK